MRSLNQSKKIIFVCVITAAAMFFAVPAAQTAYADTQAPVKYVDENGTEHQVNSYTVLKNDMTEIGSAEGTWYVVNENVTFEKNLKVKDNAKANLILCEGKKMRCKDNFTVNETSELTIWGQKQTSGELESSGGYFSAYAAIGGAPDHSNGLIEIHSGNVIAHLGGAIFFNRGAAIGAGNGADGGEIRILGGKVHAYTEGAGTGIGGGHKGGSGKIQISGGDVTGHSKAEGAGIGSGDEAGDNAKGEIIITGGKVDAHGEIGAGIGGIEDPEIKFYVHWNEPVTEIDLAIDEPVCGTEIKLDESGKPDVTPQAELTGAQPSTDAVAKMQSLWNTSDGKKAFEGTITGGDQYETVTGIEPAFGYYIPGTAEISVNGQTPAAGQVTAVNNAIELRMNMTAVHAYGEDPAPTWTWNGYESATATFTCTVDPSHVTTLTDDEIYREVKREASHTKEGIVNYTAAVEYGGGVYPNTITQLLPKTDHEWGAPDYTWMDDNHRVLAKRQCQLEPSHFETEVAQTSSEVIREATCTEAGTTKYTADFANEAFSQQIKEEADTPALGHDWDEWMETTPATEDTAGEEARACSRCTETQTRIIPPKDHRHGLRHIAAKAATCTENGWVEYYVCDRGDHPCGRYYADPEGEQSIDDPFIPALGHNYQVEWKWSDDNTSSALSYVCLNDEADAGTVAAEVRVEETPATCEKAGKKLYVATVANGPGEKALKINAKTGKITVKKKTKKGTYKMNVTVTAAGNGNYNAKVQTVTVKIRVK